MQINKHTWQNPIIKKLPSEKKIGLVITEINYEVK